MVEGSLHHGEVLVALAGDLHQLIDRLHEVFVVADQLLVLLLACGLLQGFFRGLSEAST